MNRFALRVLTILASILILITASGCDKVEDTNEVENVELVVLNAGSLVVPFEEIEKQFEALYPHIDVRMEGHGSIQVMRHIMELHDDVDVGIVADDSLVEMLMYHTNVPDTSTPYADWTVQFATNNLGIAYSPRSAYSDEINADNWFDIISRNDVTLGFSDPRIDACGYRTLMLSQLAEDYYGDSYILEKVISNHITSRITASENEDGVTVISVPEILQPKDKRTFLRGFSVQLIALLQAEQVDYVFLYESVARQQGFEFLSLPDEISLSSEAHADEYSKVCVDMEFQRFSSVDPVYIGKPIIYGLTISEGSENKEEAELFLEFVLSDKGQSILASCYQPPLTPPRVDNKEALPQTLKPLVE